MLWIILGVVGLTSLLIPVFLSLDSKDTHKKCKYCRRSIKIETTRCRYCKKILIEYPEE